MPRGGPRPNSGGARPGAGGPPTNLRAIVRYVEVDGEQVGQNVIDAVAAELREGAFLHDAGPMVGVTVETLRRWRSVGVKCLTEITEGRKRRSEMSTHERNCMELAGKMQLAEAEARARLRGAANALAYGGGTRTETTVKLLQPVDDAGKPKGDPVELERTERTIEAAPDPGMVRWLMSARWPEDYGRTRVEHTGEGGGPIVVDARPAIERIAEHLAGIRAAREESAPERLSAALSGNGGNGNGHTS